MSAKRVADLLAGRAPDRLPWVPEINEGFARKLTGCPPAALHESGRPYREIEREAARRIGADYLHRVKNVRVVRRRVEIETDPASGVTTIHTPAGDLRRQQSWDSNSGTVFTREQLVKGPESFPAYRAMIEDETYEPDYEKAEREIADSDLATIDVPATPLQHLIMWDMGVQETLMAMMEQADQMADLLAFVHERYKEFYRLAVAGPGQIIRPMEDTSSRLTGPRMYREHCVWQLNEYAGIVHAAGKTFLPHMCGHLGGAMTDVLAEIDLDGIEAITPPPLGDADLTEMRRKLGDDVWLLGGVDPSLYATATVEELTGHVRRTLDAMRGDRRFMLGHEEIPVAAKPDNIRAVAALVEETARGFYS